MDDLEIFASALRGDDVRLRELAGEHGLVCTAVEPGSVFLIRPAEDGGQRGTLAVVGASGGGSVSKVRLPRSFPVRRIGYGGGCFVLTAGDGREVRGTPAQFGAWPKILTAEHNPAYEQHLEEAFLATHLFPDGPRDPLAAELPPPGTAWGGLPADEIVRRRYVVVPAAGQDLSVSFDCAGPEKVAELLPHALEVVAEFGRIRRTGAEFLWDWGANGDESEEDRAGFLDAVAPTDLVVLRSGDFEVHFDDVSGRYFPDGYWGAVQYRRDMTPASGTMEA
ncbi:hypothetical protein AB0K86_07845 [Streptomyces clavifer]|uniref:hypothetical protein n=1 Tax=Streptomyces TaxID=1883 RepID=UPI0006FE4041|nr:MULTISPECIES: hypothetical protein [unclassified Streptomyces]KQX78823.1 hypothetical protein ASD26_09910 [Streptomyces sp. Root1319]KQZ03835.1 hypothetical protein ASD51_18635 [Streptomyces sp. Root55]